MKYTIGIDLGGTTMTAGVVNEACEIVGKLTWPTRLPRPSKDLEKAMAELCRTVAGQCGVSFSDVEYVGIGTPGRSEERRVGKECRSRWSPYH